MGFSRGITAKCGDPGGYNRHMIDGTEPCEKCKEYVAWLKRRYRTKLYFNGGKKLAVPAIGTQRRLRALSTLGYSWIDVAKKLGQSSNNVSMIVHDRKWVYPETAEKIRALYDELSMFPKPDSWQSKLTKTRAHKHGSVGPLAWDDDTIDDPHALPYGLNAVQLWWWYVKCANLTERMEWVLANGFPARRYS